MKPKVNKLARSARKLATKGKVKKWKKGQSSSSNPSAKLHREAAKNRFFNVNLGPSNLTIDALNKHDAHSELGDVDAGLSDVASQSTRTMSTWASNWTDCTNTTFNKVHRHWTSNNSFHKEVLAVLAAVTQVIKDNGGTESETEYFAALVTSLETVDGEDSVAAVLYLLSLVVKKVPSQVLKNQFSNVAKRLMEALDKYSNCESTSLLKSLLKSLAALLRSQDPATWSEASTLHIYNTLLSYTIYPKPKVRKQAQQCVCAVLKASDFMLVEKAPAHHPAAIHTAKYCNQVIEEHGAGNNSTSLQALALLKNVLGVLPKHSVKTTCETILRLMTLSDVVTKSVCMQALHGMFLSRPKATSLPSELNTQIIVALYDYVPGPNDAQPLAAWMAVMQQAHINLATLDGSLCVSHLPRLVSTCLQCMLSEREDGIKASADAIKLLLDECLRPSMDMIRPTMIKSTNTPIHKIYQALESGLGYQYHQAWGHVLSCLATFVQIVGKGFHKVVSKSLTMIADLRESHRFAYKPEVDYTIGAAIRSLGPKPVLLAVPLLINGDEKDNLDFPRSWLIPLLRDNIRETELAYFVDYFLPLAAKLKERATKMEAEGSTAGAKTYSILHYQIWSLLPGFCTKPTDLKDSFKNLARVLGSSIATKSELQLQSMASLRKLVLQNKENDANRQELARFAKNYLPILFNLYSTDPEKIKDPVRLASLETIKFYMQITESELILSFYDTAYKKLENTECTSFTRHALMDLINTMLPYVSSDRLQTLYKFFISNLQSKDRTTQKKVYRGLEELCGSDTDTCRQFVASHVTELQTTFLQSLSSAHASSKAPRLRCLINMVKSLENSDMDFIRTVLPEAILCTKETAERARAAAFLLLIEMCEAATRWVSKPKPEVVFDYFNFIVTGLDADSPQQISTTLLALTKLLFHYRADVQSELLDIMCSRICDLMKAVEREIVDAALHLLKVVLGSFREVDLAKYLQDIVGALVAMADGHHFRFRAKPLFERLIRKFGFETVGKMVPESHHRFLNNIRKTQDRLKRQRKEMGESEFDDEQENFTRKSMPESLEDFLKDSDSEMEQEEDKNQQPKRKMKVAKRRGKAGQAWLKEGDEDDMVDFLDKSAAQRIMATEPLPNDGESSKGDIVKHDFKTAADGRLIISMDDDDDKEHKPKGKASHEPNAEDILEAIKMKSGKFGKRKRAALPDDDDDDEPAIKYQPGGSGIHRPVAASKIKDQKQQERYAKSRVTGEEYRGKKGSGGDVKKKGKPDPYAYIPLTTSSLNRRKQAKFKGQFTNFVKSARKGAMAGRKAKGKRSKK